MTTEFRKALSFAIFLAIVLATYFFYDQIQFWFLSHFGGITLTHIKIIIVISVAILAIYMYYKQPDILRQVIAVSTDTKLGKKVSFLLPTDDDINRSESSSGGESRKTSHTTQKRRSVSGYLKRKIAADQQWKCGHCNSTLDETYEVDHKIGLFEGGTNDISNLIALCRNCHGKKTFAERIHSANTR